MSAVPLSRRVFDKFDLDRSGSIDIRELRAMVYELGHYMNDAQLGTAMAVIDRNGDGTISYNEFLAWWRTQDRFSKIGGRTAEDDERLSRAVQYFQYFDKDRSGEIDGNEFKALHADLVKNSFTKLSLKDCLAVLDEDGDGHVSFNEYINWLIRIGSLRG